MLTQIGTERTYAIVSSQGGTVRDFVVNGDHIIYPEQRVGEKNRGGIPICFPFFGKTPAGFDSLPQHGWLRSQKLTLVCTTEISAVYQGTNEPTPAYPWSLSYIIDATVRPDAQMLMVSLLVQRLADRVPRPAPVNPAFHPYFTTFGSAQVIGQDINETRFFIQSRRVPFSHNTHILTGRHDITLQAGDNAGINRRAGLLVLWSDNPEKYFCVEPVLGHPSSFNEGEGHYLRECELLEFRMQLRVGRRE